MSVISAVISMMRLPKAPFRTTMSVPCAAPIGVILNRRNNPTNWPSPLGTAFSFVPDSHDIKAKSRGH